MKLVKKGGLTQQKKLSFLSPRGALWVQVDFNGSSLQIINTHLGLRSLERRIHTMELLGPDWLRNPKCTAPVVLCGDFNTVPGSRVFNLLDENIKRVRQNPDKPAHKKTWFGRYPIACLDHIFASEDFEVVNVEVCDSYLARLASDHRPIITDLKINSPQL